MITFLEDKYLYLIDYSLGGSNSLVKKLCRIENENIIYTDIPSFKSEDYGFGEVIYYNMNTIMFIYKKIII